MKAFYHGENGFINPSRVVVGVEAVRANLLDRLSIIRGEWVSDVTLGVPLGASKTEIDLNIQQVILGTDGVRGILDFSSTMPNKTYHCKFTVDTDFGRLTYE